MYIKLWKILHLFAWRHQVLVGFQDVCERFLDVLLFHAGQNRWRQKLCQTPLLSIKTRRETLNSNALHNSQTPFIFSSHLKEPPPETFYSPSCRSNPNHFLSLVKHKLRRLGRTFELLLSIKWEKYVSKL